MRLALCALLAVAAVSPEAAAAVRFPGAADLVLRGGRVWAGKGIAGGTALAVKDGRVLVVGADDAVSALVGAGHAGGGAAWPTGGTGVQRRPRPLPERRLRPPLRRLSATRRTRRRWRGASAPTRRRCPRARGSWRGTGTTRRGPRRRSRPAGCSTRRPRTIPVFVQRLDGHMALANSPGPAPGRHHARDEGPGRRAPSCGTRAASPPAILKDNAQDLVSKAIPEPTREMNLRAARAALQEAARVGVTTVQDNSSIDALPTYQDLRAPGELTARLYVWRLCVALVAAAGGRRADRPGRRLDPAGRAQDPRRRLHGCGHRRLLRALRRRPHDQRPAALPARRAGAHGPGARMRPGFQLAVHAIGDRANSLVLDAFEKAARPPTAAATAASASSTPRWCARRTSRASSRWAWSPPSSPRTASTTCGGRSGASARSARRTPTTSAPSPPPGVPVAFGTDWYVEPLDPRLGLYAAVTRERPEGGPAGGWLPGGEAHPRGGARPLHARLRLRRVRGGRARARCSRGCWPIWWCSRTTSSRWRRAQILTTPVDLTVVGGRLVFDPAKARGRAPAHPEPGARSGAAPAGGQRPRRIGSARPRRSWTARSPTRARPTRLDGVARHNEPLEFLGDAVLGFVVADLLHRRDPEGDEGEKSKARAHLVAAPSLSRAGAPP